MALTQELQEPKEVLGELIILQHLGTWGEGEGIDVRPNVNVIYLMCMCNSGSEMSSIPSLRCMVLKTGNIRKMQDLRPPHVHAVGFVSKDTFKSHFITNYVTVNRYQWQIQVTIKGYVTVSHKQSFGMSDIQSFGDCFFL